MLPFSGPRMKKKRRRVQKTVPDVGAGKAAEPPMDDDAGRAESDVTTQPPPSSRPVKPAKVDPTRVSPGHYKKYVQYVKPVGVTDASECRHEFVVRP